MLRWAARGSSPAQVPTVGKQLLLLETGRAGTSSAGETGDQRGYGGEGQALVYSSLSLWSGRRAGQGPQRGQPVMLLTVAWGPCMQKETSPLALVKQSTHTHTHTHTITFLAHARKGQLLENWRWRPRMTLQPSPSEKATLHPLLAECRPEGDTWVCSSESGQCPEPGLALPPKSLTLTTILRGSDTPVRQMGKLDRKSVV